MRIKRVCYIVRHVHVQIARGSSEKYNISIHSNNPFLWFFPVSNSRWKKLAPDSPRRVRMNMFSLMNVFPFRYTLYAAAYNV